jgi:hypothetical protein
MRHVLKAINKCGWEITEVVCGCAEGVDTLGRERVESGHCVREMSGSGEGVDTLGREWVERAGIPVQEFPADWDNIDVPGAVVKTTKYGKCYNAAAGPARNQRMADYSEALILIHNGSRGSRDMLKRAKAKGLKIFEVIV